MRLNRSALLLIIFFLVLSNRVIGQCFPVDGNIDIYDLENQPNNVLTLTGSTDGAANTFAIPTGELSGLQFPSSDIIYEMVIEVGDTFNLFFDLCPGTNFDASIGIIHKEDISDCANATDNDIVGIEDVSLYNEWSDANGLCPQADFTDNPGFVPIARDVHLDPGTYYIVVDGFSDGLVGDFTLVIGEMLTFDDYNLQQQIQYVDIVFTAPVYGVFDDTTWTLGWPMNNANPPNASDYFEFKVQDTEQIIQIGPALQANGQNLPGPQAPPYPGYDVLRFPLINPPPDGSIIEVTPVYYNFNDNGLAPHPVNLSGIPFEQTMMEIELNVLSAPEIDSIYNLSEDNNSLTV